MNVALVGIVVNDQLLAGHINYNLEFVKAALVMSTMRALDHDFKTGDPAVIASKPTDVFTDQLS